jgi:hypothetical protein
VSCGTVAIGSMADPAPRIPPLVRSPLRFGLIGGVVGFGLIVALFYMGSHPLLVPVFLDFRIVLFGVFLFFSLRELRDYYFGGILYFWQGMVAGFILIITFAIIASGLMVAFGSLESRFVSTYIEQFTEQARQFPPEVIDRIGREAFERNLATLPGTSPFDLALLYFWQCFVIGFFISIIISVILRRQPVNQ